ncbi:unnamed protein product [Boreogadus saida]
MTNVTLARPLRRRCQLQEGTVHLRVFCGPAAPGQNLSSVPGGHVRPDANESFVWIKGAMVHGSGARARQLLPTNPSLSEVRGTSAQHAAVHLWTVGLRHVSNAEKSIGDSLLFPVHDSRRGRQTSDSVPGNDAPIRGRASEGHRGKSDAELRGTTEPQLINGALQRPRSLCPRLRLGGTNGPSEISTDVLFVNCSFKAPDRSGGSSEERIERI